MKINTSSYFVLKTGIIVIIVSLILFFIIQLPAISKKETKSPRSLIIPVIASVNGENITGEEFRLFINQNRAMTFNYFVNKYKADLSRREFWSTQFGDENPTEYIKDTALQSSIMVKLQQVVAREKGIVSYIDYSDFKDRLVQENARRKYDKENSGIIYGPVKYTTKMYYNYLFSQMLIALKRKMAQHEFKISDMELNQEYESTKNERFRNRDQIKVEIITPLSGKDTIFTKLTESVENINKLENIINVYRDQINISEMQINDETYDLYFRQNESLVENIYQLTIDQSIVFRDNDNQLSIIRCITHEKSGYKSFEEVKELVRLKWIDNQYEDWLKMVRLEADIRVNEEYLNEVITDLL